MGCVDYSVAQIRAVCHKCIDDWAHPHLPRNAAELPLELSGSMLA
jgi:hypothetical protein